VSTLILWLGDQDERLLRALVVRRRRPLDRFFRAVTHGADPAVVIVLTGGLALGLLPELVAVGRRAALTLALCHSTVELAKRLVGRPRPRLPIGMEWLVNPPDRFSFPSGHAAAALAVALPLTLGLGTPAAPLVLVLAALIGVSRCYLGVHYPGDVLAGWTIAAGSAAAAALIAGPIH